MFTIIFSLVWIFPSIFRRSVDNPVYTSRIVHLLFSNITSSTFRPWHTFLFAYAKEAATFDKQSIERLWTKGANITTTFGVVSKPRLPATLPSSISLESRPSLPDLCVSRLASRGSAVAAGWRKREQSFNPLHSYPTFYYYKWIYFYISIHIPGTLVTMFSFSLCLKWMKDNKDNKRYMCIFYFSNFFY